MAVSGSCGPRGFTLTLVHTNDTHAHLEPMELTLSGKRVRVGAWPSGWPSLIG